VYPSVSLTPFYFRLGETPVNMPLPQYFNPHPASLEPLPVSSLLDSTPLDVSEKITAQGRFFFNNHEKFFLKGVTYRPESYRRNSMGSAYIFS
jgi:hypothetical protein